MSLMQIIGEQLSATNIHKISSELGTDEEATKLAVGAAVPTLLAALTRNASDQSGAEALNGALSRDHDGSLLDHLDDYLGGGGASINPRAARGDDIVQHVLGDKQQRVASGVGQISGLDAQTIIKLLAILAPIVMAALGRQKKEKDLDSDGVADVLQKEREAERQEAEDEKNSFWEKWLDQDGDQDFDAADILKVGMGMVGRMFKK